MGEQLFRNLKILKKCILKIIYPSEGKCIICNKDGYEGICNSCLKEITFCNNSDLCIGYYKGVLKKLILLLKYKSDFEAGEILTDLLADKLKGISKDYYLTYIPIGKISLEKRRFNQCEYIANELGIKLGLKVVNTLKRVKETKVQKTLKREERLENLKNAFGIINEDFIRGRKFILIDDVMTTGATLYEGKKVLESMGAKEVTLLCVAKSTL